jgi:integrase
VAAEGVTLCIELSIHSWLAEGPGKPQSAHLALVPPTSEKFTVGRKPNAEYPLTGASYRGEVERLIEAVKDNRWGHRDATMVLIAFKHGLRAAELIDLRWDQVDLDSRLKNGSPATHPLTGRELRALRRLQREQPKSPIVFISERAPVRSEIQDFRTMG